MHKIICVRVTTMSSLPLKVNEKLVITMRDGCVWQCGVRVSPVSAKAVSGMHSNDLAQSHHLCGRNTTLPVPLNP